MAVKEIEAVKSDFNQVTTANFVAATTIADGLKFKLPSSDEYVVILVNNTGTEAASISVKAPQKGSYAASTSDLTKQLDAGEIAVIRIESAKYAENNGEVALTTTKTAVKVAVVY